MFGIGGTEIVIIAIFALLIFGPDKIPDIARQVGRIVADFKRYQATMEAAFRAEMNAGGEDTEHGEQPDASKPKIPAYATEEDEEDEEEE